MYRQITSNLRQAPGYPYIMAQGRLSNASVLVAVNRDIRYKNDNQKSDGVSLPGFQKVLHPENSRCKRILWSLFFAACFGLCGWLLKIKISLYLEAPTILDSSPVLNKTVVFPAITLCPIQEPLVRDSVHYGQLLELAKMHNKTGNVTIANFEETAKFNETLNFTLLDVWTETLMFDTQIRAVASCGKTDGKLHCNFQNGVATTIKNSTYDTFWGRCRLFTPELPMEYRGPATFLTIAIDGYKHYLIHAPNGINYTAQYIIHDHETIHRHDAYLLPACLCARWLNTIELTVKQNKSNNVCYSPREFSECYNHYLDEELTKVLKCRLPFMSNSTLIPCQTWQSALEAHTRAKQFYNQFKLDPSRCRRKCYETIYVKNLVKVKIDESKQTTLLNLEFADNQFANVTEIDVYCLTALLGDATAFIGFFLGICMLSVFEILESLFEAIVKWRPR